MTKFLDLFEPIQKGDFGLTDQAIYWSIQAGGKFIPIWGGNQEHTTIDRLVSENGSTKDGFKITVFNGEGIIISLDGSSGSMTYKANQKFALNHHAGFFKVRKDAEKKIIPEFFALFYQEQLKNTSISDGSKTLTLDQIKKIEIEIPKYDTQKAVMQKITPLLAKKKTIRELLDKIESIKSRHISYDYKEYQAKNIKINDVLDYMSGNSGLSESEIYLKILEEGPRYTVLSSSTEHDTRLGNITLCEINGKPIRVFNDREGLLVIRNGKAGTTMFLERGKYTTNDHAYILYVKDGCKYKISLKWLRAQYRSAFLEYSSSADNGTWNMTGFYENVIIDIPDYKEQLLVANEFEKLEAIEKKLNLIESKIDGIFIKPIV